METNTSETKDNRSKWGSYGVLATIAIVLVTFLYNDSKTESPAPEQAASAPASGNSELEAAQDRALNSPDFLAYLNLGLIYYRTGEYRKCITMTLKALKYPTTPANQALAYNNICSAYNVLNMPDSAIQACEKALTFQPDLQIAKNNLNAAVAAKKK